MSEFDPRGKHRGYSLRDGVHMALERFVETQGRYPHVVYAPVGIDVPSEARYDGEQRGVPVVQDARVLGMFKIPL